MIDVTESPEERETRNNNQTKKRILFLAGLMVLTLSAKMIFKNPPPPKAPDHGNRPFRALPGILKNLPESERKKLTAQQIAMLGEADRTGGLPGSPKEMLAQKPQTPMEQRGDLSKVTIQDFKSYEYMERKTRRAETRPPPPIIDHTKDTLVLFTRGGHLIVQDAERINGSVQIALDRTIHARIPRFLVHSIRPASLWVEPIPRGKTQLKPAPGITIVVSSAIAKRITLQKT